MDRNQFSPWLCAMVCCLLVAAPFARAQSVAKRETSWGLPQLMRGLAQVRSASARFTECKTMKMLNAPLASSGMLTYLAPDRIQKITLSPIPARFVLDHDRVTISGGPDHQTHTFLLSQYPQIGGLVEGIRATLAGDLATLNRFYVVQFSGTARRWQILLQPKNAGLTHFLRWIRIEGSENRISAIDTESSDGDRSEMNVVEDTSDAR